MQQIYQHPWYLVQQKQESTTDSESESTPSQTSETTGLKHTDEQEIIWAAGLYEGEGTLYHNKRKDYWTIRVRMSDLDVVKHFASVWNLKIGKPEDFNNYASVIKSKEITGSTNDRKICYSTETAARGKVFEIVCDIYPYLGARRRAKCDEFLQWYAEKEGMKYD